MSWRYLVGSLKWFSASHVSTTHRGIRHEISNQATSFNFNDLRHVIRRPQRIYKLRVHTCTRLVISNTNE